MKKIMLFLLKNNTPLWVSLPLDILKFVIFVLQSLIIRPIFFYIVEASQFF
jgi:hypothetical protein